MVEFFELFSSVKMGIPIAVSIISMSALVYVYNDSKKERIERQQVMDRQNAQWLELYKENLNETAQIREEMGKTREVISELKGVIQSLYDMGIKRAY